MHDGCTMGARWSEGKMAIRLTDAICARAEPGARHFDIYDSSFNGLSLRVHPGGRKSWYYRWQRGRAIKLGTFPEMNCFEARALAKQKMIEAAQGADLVEAKRERLRPKPQGLTFAAFVADQFMPEIIVTKTRKTVEGYRHRLNRDLLPLLGKKPLADIDLQTVERWRTKRRASGLSTGYIESTIIVLRSVLKLAVDRKELDADPLKGIKALHVDKSHVRYLSADERSRLHAALATLPPGDNMRCGIIISLHTGLRSHELFNLQWKDIDIPARMLKVQAGNAKSGKARMIPLNRDAMAALAELKEKAFGSYVLHLAGGRPYTVTRFRTFKTFMAKAGIHEFRWHDLRHDFASRQAQAGIDIPSISKLLGHSDLSMTMRYAHLSDESLRRAVAALETAETGGNVVDISTRRQG